MFAQPWFLLLFPGLPLVGFFLWMSYFIRRREKSSRRPFLHMSRPPGWSLQKLSAESAAKEE